MEVQVKHKEFLRALQGSITCENNPIKAINEIKLEASGKKLHVTTTDGNMRVEHRMEAEIQKEGTVLVPSKKLLALIKECNAETVDLNNATGTKTVIRAGNARFELNGVPVDEFPKGSDITRGPAIIIQEKDLLRALDHTLFAAGTDESRSVLTTILISIGKDSATFTASNGGHLATITIPAETPGPLEITLPRSAANELRQITTDSETKVKIRANENLATFSFEKATFTTPLSAETYPNYKAAIPKESSVQVTCQADSLLEVVQRVAILADDHKIELSLEKNAIRITAKSPTYGTATETVESNHKGSFVTIALNPDYLIKGIGHLRGKEIALEFHGKGPQEQAQSPLLTKTEDFLYLIMPLRQ